MLISCAAAISAVYPLVSPPSGRTAPPLTATPSTITRPCCRLVVRSPPEIVGSLSPTLKPLRLGLQNTPMPPTQMPGSPNPCPER
jgi:hypothetical protein